MPDLHSVEDQNHIPAPKEAVSQALSAWIALPESVEAPPEEETAGQRAGGGSGDQTCTLWRIRTTSRHPKRLFHWRCRPGSPFRSP